MTNKSEFLDPLATTAVAITTFKTASESNNPVVHLLLNSANDNGSVWLVEIPLAPASAPHTITKPQLLLNEARISEQYQSATGEQLTSHDLEKLQKYLEHGFGKNEKSSGRVPLEFLEKHLQGFIVDLDEMDAPYSLHYKGTTGLPNGARQMAFTDNHNNHFYFPLSASNRLNVRWLPSLPIKEYFNNIHPVEHFVEQVCQNDPARQYCLDNSESKQLGYNTHTGIIFKREAPVTTQELRSGQSRTNETSCPAQRVIDVKAATIIVGTIGIIFSLIDAGLVAATAYVCLKLKSLSKAQPEADITRSMEEPQHEDDNEPKLKDDPKPPSKVKMVGSPIAGNWGSSAGLQVNLEMATIPFKASQNLPAGGLKRTAVPSSKSLIPSLKEERSQEKEDTETNAQLIEYAEL